MPVSRSSSSIPALWLLDDDAPKLPKIKFNTRRIRAGIQVSFTMMAGKTRRRFSSPAFDEHRQCNEAVLGK
jgi:hypothetical protein